MPPVNNAAIDSPPSAPPEENGLFEEYPEASWDKVVDVNLKGVYLCCQVFGAAMALADKAPLLMLPLFMVLYLLIRVCMSIAGSVVKCFISQLPILLRSQVF